MAEPQRPALPAPPSIFINYRREDTGGYAGRLYDELKARFGGERVFMDLGAIEIGEKFPEQIDRAARGCKVMLTLIGRQWLNVTDKGGRRRLENEKDFVRREIAAGLASGVTIIPVLLQRAEMPGDEDLPEDLKELAAWQAVELSDKRWAEDLAQLVQKLEDVLGWRRKAGGWPARLGLTKRKLALIYALVILSTSAFGWWAWKAYNQDGPGKGVALAGDRDVSSFSFDYPFDDANGKGPREWFKKDQTTWVERFPNGKEGLRVVTGKTSFQGDNGTLLQSADSPRYEYFLPDKGSRIMRLYIRADQGRWRELGPMNDVK